MRSITAEEATKLRDRIAALTEGKPRGAPERTVIRRVAGKGNYYGFMKGERSLSPRTATRLGHVLAKLEGAPAASPARKSKVGGNRNEYLGDAEAAALRADAKAAIERVGNLRRLLSAAGIPTGSHGEWGYKIEGKKPFTLRNAQELRNAIAGRPAREVAAPRTKRTARRRSVPSPAAGSPRAPRNIANALRADLQRVLGSQYGHNVPALVQDLGVGMTAAKLSKFVDGGPISLDESAQVATALTRVASPSAPVAPQSLAMAVMRFGQTTVTPPALAMTSPQPTAEPLAVAARKMVARWGADAIQLVLQFAQAAGDLG